MPGCLAKGGREEVGCRQQLRNYRAEWLTWDHSAPWWSCCWPAVWRGLGRTKGAPSPTSEAGECWERQCQPRQAMGGAGR